MFRTFGSQLRLSCFDNLTSSLIWTNCIVLEITKVFSDLMAPGCLFLVSNGINYGIRDIFSYRCDI